MNNDAADEWASAVITRLLYTHVAFLLFHTLNVVEIR